jgi:hypothetical protein
MPLASGRTVRDQGAIAARHAVSSIRVPQVAHFRNAE